MTPCPRCTLAHAGDCPPDAARIRLLGAIYYAQGQATSCLSNLETSLDLPGSGTVSNLATRHRAHLDAYEAADQWLTHAERMARTLANCTRPDLVAAKGT